MKMKKMTRSVLLFLFSMSLFNTSDAQTVLYSTDFSGGSPFPTGWTEDGANDVGAFTISTANPSSGYTDPNASGTDNLLMDDNVSFGFFNPQIIVLNTGTLSTVGYVNIGVKWGAMTSNPNGGFPGPIIFEWSTDGATWNPETFTDINYDGSWQVIPEITLPAGAEEAANLQFRISFSVFNSGDVYAIDDFRVTGQSLSTFYSKATGNLDDLATWGLNTDGSGANPTDFTSDAKTFNIRNNATPTIGANWVVSGAGSKVVVESASSSNFTIPSGFSFTGTIDVESGGTLTINNTTIPTMGTLGANSTVIYSASTAQSIAAASYGNLTISNTATTVITHTMPGNVTVGAVLNLSAGTYSTTALSISTHTLTLNGTVIGPGTITGSASSNMVIGGTGALGTITFTGGNVRLNNFTINRTSSGTVNLGTGALQVNGILTLTDGTLYANSGLNLMSTVTQTSGTISYSSGTPGVVYNQGSAGQYVASGTYYNLAFSNQNKVLASSGTIGIFNAFTKGTATGHTITGSTIDFNGTGSQSIPAAFNYNNLTISNTRTGANNVTLSSAGTVSVSGTFNPAATFGTGGYVVTNTTVNFCGTSSQTIPAFNYNNLTSSSSGARVLASSGTIGIAGTFTPGSNAYTITGSTVNFNSTSAQTVPVFDFNNLTISGARGANNVTLAAGAVGVFSAFSPTATFSTGTFVVTGNLITFNGTGAQTIPAFNYNSLVSASSGSRTLASSGTIGVGDAFVPHTNVYTITGSTIEFYGSALQSIPAFNYNNLTSSSTGGRVLASSGTIGVAGVFTPGSNAYTITGSTVDFNGSGAQGIPAFNYNNLTSSSTGGRTLAAAGTVGVAGTFTPGTNVYTITGSTIDFNGSGAQTIPAFDYNNLTSSSTGGRTLAGAGTIGVASVFTPGTNVYTVTGSTVNFNGSAAQTIPAFSFNNLSQNNAAGVALAGNVDLTGICTIGAGTLTTTGFNFTLLSTIGATASIDAIPAGAGITGNIIMQRYTPASLNSNDWRFLGAPVDESTVTIADWADDFATSGFTGSTDPGNPYSSIYWYDESQAGDLDTFGFVSATNVTDPIVKGRGYWVYIGPSPVTFEVTGAPYQQTQSLEVTYNNSGNIINDGWCLVANPYPCTIDWDAPSDATHWTKTNIGDEIQVYNSSTGTYAAYSTSMGGTNGGTRYIASQQAFWVKADGGGAPVLTARELVKVAAQNPSYFKTQNSPNTSPAPIAFKDFFVPLNTNTNPDVLRLTASGNGYDDEILVGFKQGATNNYDSKFDAWKLTNLNTDIHNFSSVISGNKDLAINAMPPLTSAVSVPIRLTVPVAGTYKISRDSILMLPLSSCIVLEDKATSSMIDLRSVVSYTFTISDTTAAPRFILHVSSPLTKKSVSASCASASNGMAIATGVGAGPWNYTWKNSTGAIVKTTTGSSVADTLFNCGSDTYSITVTSATCGSVTDTIVVNAPAALSAIPAKTDVSCFGGNNGSASVSISGGTSSYSYLWGGGQTTTALSGLSFGNYSVTVTDGNGCTLVESFLVSQPAAITSTVSATAVSCFGGNNGLAAVAVSGGSASYSYLWSNNATTSQISGLSSQVYSVAITDANGCTATTSVSVSQPAVLTTTVSQTNVSCFGGNNGIATVSPAGGNAPYTYLWSNNAITPQISGLAPMLYSVAVTDAKGCTSAASVTIAQPAILTNTISPVSVSCFGENDGSVSVTVTGGTGPYIYSWNSGQSTSAVSNIPAGNYHVMITDAKGCSTIASTSVTQPVLLTAGYTTSSDTVDISLGSDVTFTNTSVGAASYEWNFGDGSVVDNSSDPIHSYTATGTYTVTLISSNGPCADTTFNTVFVTNSNPTALNTDQYSSHINVGYEHGDVYLIFSFSKATQVNIHVYNMLGEEIFSKNNQIVKEDKIRLDLPSSAAGVYIAVSEMTDALVSKKIILPVR